MIYRYIFLLTGLALAAGHSKGMDQKNNVHTSFFRQELDEKDEKIEALESECLKQRVLLQQYQSNLSQKEAELEDLRATLRAKDFEIEKLKKENSIFAKSINQKGTLRCSFSPKIDDQIIYHINNEQRGIRGAMYRFTLYNIATVWKKRKNEGKITENKLCIDRDYQDDFCAALRLLVNNGIEVFSTYDQNGMEKAHMHHKFIIFSKNINNRPLLVIGSFNCTGQATTYNWENVCFIEDADIIKCYEEEFNKLYEKQVPVSASQCTYMGTKDKSSTRRLNHIPSYEDN